MGGLRKGSLGVGGCLGSPGQQGTRGAWEAGSAHFQPGPHQILGKPAEYPVLLRGESEVSDGPELDVPRLLPAGTAAFPLAEATCFVCTFTWPGVVTGRGSAARSLQGSLGACRLLWWAAHMPVFLLLFI